MIIIACSIFHREINTVFDREGLSGVSVVGEQAKCGQQKKSDGPCYQDSDDSKNKSECIYLGNNCTENRCSRCGFKNETDQNDSDNQCYDIIAPQEFINYYIEKGYYIISSGWLSYWEYFVKKLWGFNESNAKIFFKDSARKIMLFDTGVFDDTESKIKEFSEFSGLEYDLIPVGINYLTNRIKFLIEESKTESRNAELKKGKAEIRKQKADNVLIFDFIKKFNDLHSEREIIEAVLNLFDVLCSPAKAAFFSVKDDQLDHTISVQSFDSADAYFAQCSFESAHRITESGKGIILKIKFKDHLFGFMLLEELLFPDFISKYIRVIELISTTTGMFLANNFYVREINEAKEVAQENEQIIKGQKEVLEEYNEEIRILLDNLEEKNSILKDLNASKDKLFSIIGHDLKNPFSAILGFTQLLRVNYYKIEDEERLRYINIIDESSKNVYKLLENLLEWARLQRNAVSFSPEALALSTIITDTIEIYQSQAKEKGINLHSFVSADVKVFADQEMLRAIIRNLVSNAIKYTSTQGKISIHAQSLENKVEIAIVDDGTGMDKETQDNLFKIGETQSVQGTKGESGTGLGLIITKDFIEKHGEKIWVESEQGKGCAFKFTLSAEPSDLEE